MVTLTGEEIAEIKYEMQAGKLPPDALKKHFEAEAKTVFGHDAKKNRKGQYIEQGIGSAINQTKNSVLAYEKHCKGEPGFEENLKRMRQELAESEERRKAALEAQGDDV